MNDFPPTEDSSLPLSKRMRIDSVCLEFEEAWHSDTRPKVEDFLGDASGKERLLLLEELLLLDLEYRR